MIEIPILETERLILRAPQFKDLEPLEAFFQVLSVRNSLEVLSIGAKSGELYCVLQAIGIFEAMDSGTL